MITQLSGRLQFFFAAHICVALIATPALSEDAPILLPGAPGQAVKELSAEDAIKIAQTRHTKDDVSFMQNMIVHHQQAVDMSRLVTDRTSADDVVEISGKIEAAQADEIAFMQGWLTERAEHAPDPAKNSNGGHHNHNAEKHATTDHNAPDHTMMAGMASPAQLKALAAAKNVEFDRMFLELMIEHHEGAIIMVDNLLERPGSAYDPTLFSFVSDIKNDQTAEITKMNVMLAGLSVDPRANLAAGLRDSGTAISNLKLIASLEKPAGFFNPDNPAGLPPKKTDASEKEADNTPARDGENNTETEWGERSPLLSFANTDMAFSGDVLVAGNYHGFNIYKLGTDGIPVLRSSVVCPGGQGDVSIVGDLLILSVEQTRGRIDCGLQGVTEDISKDRFRGLRIFDISDLSQPIQVGQVQTCRGSHTHTVVSGNGLEGEIIVYNSGTASVRDIKELDGCYKASAGDNRTALFRIDVIEIPVDDPSKARIIDSPAIFKDRKTGQLAGLWQGGDHGDETQETFITDQCHDITAFPELKLAAGACSGNGILLDISNPRKPKRIDDVTDKGFAYWHSATFNNDGTKVIFTDEWGGGSRPRCRASDPSNWGANAIYDVVDRKLRYRSYFKLPSPQTDEENCVAHNGSIVPVPGRDIFVQAWYQGGVSMMDFTDTETPREIAYFDRGPINEEILILGGYWSTYWFDGFIYGTEITRGLDVFALTPSEHLSENEIAAAALADYRGVFNPQQQFEVTWPAEPVIALAYMDQLTRADALDTDLRSDLETALNNAQSLLKEGKGDKALSDVLKDLTTNIAALPSGPVASKVGLSKTLDGLRQRLK